MWKLELSNFKIKPSHDPKRENGLKRSDLSLWLQQQIYQWFRSCSRPIYNWCTLCKLGRSVHGANTIDMFLESVWQIWSFKPILAQFWELFLNKYFFHPRFLFWRNFGQIFRTFWVVGGFYFEVRDFLFSHNLIILLVEAIPKCNFKSENSLF